MAFLCSNVFGVSWKVLKLFCSQPVYMTRVKSCRNAIDIEHTASAFFFFGFLACFAQRIVKT